MRRRHVPGPIVFALLLLAPAATAQTVVGRVVDEGTLEPLRGAFVVLEDDQGQRRGGVLTGPEGRFVLRATEPGTYRLLTEMIGYAGVRSEPIRLDQGLTVERTIRVPLHAITLDGLHVAAGARCRPRPGSGPETARLWEEARKALEVASWTERGGVVRFHLVRHRSVLDPRTLRVLDRHEEGSRGWSGGSPYVSIPAEALAEHGYVRMDPDGDLIYHAPDAGVLLSDLFLDHHCFAVAAPSPAEPDLIGLSFEPVGRGTLADIRGVLWLDRGSAELRRLDFNYTRLPSLPRTTWDVAGGRVEFERLATGVWIVRRWHVRMPVVALQQNPRPGAGPPEPVLTAVHETGGEVRTVLGRDGRPLGETTGATLYGLVEDAAGEPLARARVEVVPTGRVTTTGADGAFRLTDLPAGRYDLEVGHADLELMGLGPEVRTVDLEAGRSVRLPVRLAPSAALAAEVCRAGGWEPHRPAGAPPVLVHGVVTDDAGVPVPDAVVHVHHSGLGTAGARVLADSAGVYRVCMDPADGPVTLMAGHPADLAGLRSAGHGTALPMAEAGFVRADLVLSGPSAAGAGAGAVAWDNALLGTAVDEETRGPVAGAMVSLVDEAGQVVRTTVTDGTGRFRIPYPGRGQAFDLRVEHVAYGTARGAVRFDRAHELRVEVVLTTRAIALDPILVTERRRGLLAEAGFYGRRERGMGVFVEVGEAQRLRSSSITDLLVGQPLIRTVPAGDFGTDIRITGTDRIRATGLEDCQPAIYLNGGLVRPPGEPRADQPPLSDIVSPDAVAAIEVFRRPTEVPPRFGGSGAACGVVLIWSR